MKDKRIMSLLGSILLLASVLPLTTAHLTNSAGSTTSALASDGDLYRWSGTTPSPSDGVSGTYSNGPLDAFLTGGTVFPLDLGGVHTIFPRGYYATAWVLCDLEVLGDGTAHDSPDEERVDVDPHSGPGSIPDGTWDDGGIGGACHVEGQYAHDEYNSPGCGIGGSHAIAEDRVSDGDVWVGVAYDSFTRSHGDPSFATNCLLCGWCD